MLKLHHLNLLNEIHETALMLNLFEQRQLMREQQLKMRQMQNLQYTDNYESRRRHSNNVENEKRMGPSSISDDEEHEVLSRINVNKTTSSNKRHIGENQMPSKRVK
jgi:hypothetical protein